MAGVFVDGRAVEAAIAVRQAAQADGHEVEFVESVRELEGRLGGAAEVALILTGPPGESRAAAMRGLFEAEIPRPPVLGLTEETHPDARRRLARSFDLDEALSLPVDPDEVRVVLQTHLDRYDLQRQTGIIGRTEAVREILERVHMIAPVMSTVLLTGESGTGKELVARAFHRLSPRRARAFIAVNCAALPESLLESELFGHEKGAFTGATSLRRGMFELADGGTLLLDEIAEMPLPTQTRLLRVLESRRFMRVGGDHEIQVSVRVVAATNRDLRQAVETGEFRRDLYYRLNVLNVHVPPLRERRRDIPVLIRRFISEFSRQHDREFRGLAPEALQILLDYDWPGNVRELRNLIESMVVLAPGSVIRPEDIPPEIRSGGVSLVPSPARIAPSVDAGAGHLPSSPQLAFVFRTLVDLKVDIDDLKREFEAYRSGARQLPAAPARSGVGEDVEDAIEIDITDAVEAIGTTGAETISSTEDGPTPEEPDMIAIRPGMTMEEIERAAIIAVLRQAGGNRRRAAEALGIGERTIYRKIRKYGIEH
ncbi:MAG: sigma-54 dependent transcriptional regulator [Gemmatimonadota bacterium]|uniref:sigma-54 interaction domain-containing protein n=1 Tax=Candidatus Palauibacter scopulicola TaxID=3056741 RepID=UPI00238C1058|nr:sigma-54 dependent transcriptional regulator [Candidatus Palauibacter scopulicola]MDE2663165.1 sigma-54 dependent transcriptional regulator [Candidatus Palauibacter scopulicola]